MVLIGISGKIGVGKDFITSNVVIPIFNRSNYLQLAFADQIKVNVMTKMNISYDNLYYKKTDISRRLLQEEGSYGRKENSNIWVKYVENWITIYSKRGLENFVISDCRYKNESDYIKNMGGILVRVKADDRNEDRLIQEASSSGSFDNEVYNKIKNHSSECDLDQLPDNYFDIVIDNSKQTSLNIEKLQESLLEIISYRNQNCLYH